MDLYLEFLSFLSNVCIVWLVAGRESSADIGVDNQSEDMHTLHILLQVSVIITFHHFS